MYGLGEKNGGGRERIVVAGSGRTVGVLEPKLLQAVSETPM